MKCKECNIEINEHNTFKFKDGTLDNVCKNCITKDLNINNLISILYFCKHYNIPFIEQKFYAMKENSSNSRVCFGKYLSLMKLKGFRSYNFTDTQYLIDLDIQ